jgi:hypothetical protein
MTKSSKSGPVAQLGARFHGMEEVIGSIPIRSTNFLSTIQTNLPGEISDLAGAKPRSLAYSQCRTVSFPVVLSKLEEQALRPS